MRLVGRCSRDHLPSESMQPPLDTSEAPEPPMAVGAGAGAAPVAQGHPRHHLASFPLDGVAPHAQTARFAQEPSTSGSSSSSSDSSSSSSAASPTAAAAAERCTAAPGRHRTPTLLLGRDSAASACISSSHELESSSSSNPTAAASPSLQQQGSPADADSTCCQAAAAEAAAAGRTPEPACSAASSTPAQTPLAALPLPCSLLQLQVPDFAAAFSLPEECCFSESAVDEYASLPTPHTPVVASVFAGDGQQPAAPWRPHHQRHGSGGSTSSCSCSDGSGGWSGLQQQQQVGGGNTNHALQLETDVECEPHPCPATAVPTSLSAAAGQNFGGHHDNHTTQHHQQAGGAGAVLAACQIRGLAVAINRLSADNCSTCCGCAVHVSGWELPLFVSLLSRRTLSAVMEADNEGSDEETAAAAGAGAGATAAAGADSAAAGAGIGSEQQQRKPAACEEQEQEQQRDEAVDAYAVVLEVCCVPTKAADTAQQAVETAAAAEEDEWAAANKARLWEVHQQQLQQQQLSYPQLLARLMPPQCDSSNRSSKQSSLRQRLRQLFTCGCISVQAADGSSRCSSQEAAALLALAKAQLQEGNALHGALLQAVFTAWTGSSCPVPRCGPHWAALGFQGEDPGTDLRGAGLLGLLQLLWLAHTDARTAAAIFTLSTSPEQHFPLACVSFNLTVWTLAALRAGRLDGAAARLGGSHVAAANLFMSGAFSEFAARWRAGKTMADSGTVMKQLRRWCERKTRQVLKLGAERCER